MLLVGLGVCKWGSDRQTVCYTVWLGIRLFCVPHVGWHVVGNCEPVAQGIGIHICGDSFGFGKLDVHWVGGRCMDSMMEIMRHAEYPPKFEDDTIEAVVFGHMAVVDYTEEAVRLPIEQGKAERWTTDLETIIEEMIDAMMRLQTGLFSNSVGLVFPEHMTRDGPTIGHAIVQCMCHCHGLGWGCGTDSFVIGGRVFRMFCQHRSM